MRNLTYIQDSYNRMFYSVIERGNKFNDHLLLFIQQFWIKLMRFPIPAPF